MFFRKITTKKNGKEYVYVKLIENYRMDGKVKQRVIANFGSIDNLSPERINYLMASLKKLHTEIGTQGTEVMVSKGLLQQVEAVRNALEGTELKKAITKVLGKNLPWELAEALIVKILVAGEAGNPIQEVCKNLGLMDAPSVQYYNAVKRLGQEDAKGILAKTRLAPGIENNHKPVFINVITSNFEGTAFDIDVTGNLYMPQDYHKQLILLLACDEQGNPIDFEFTEEVEEVREQLELLVDRLSNMGKGHIVVLDADDIFEPRSKKFLVAKIAQDILKEFSEVLDQHSVRQNQRLYFNTVKYEQKSETKIKEIRANLAKVSAGMETIKADVLLGKLNKESAIRKRADAVIKANGCQDMISYTFDELSQTFNYSVREDVIKEKNQSIVSSSWFIELDKQDEPLIETVKLRADRFSNITDQLKIPPINMYVDYHYSPEVISGHIQLGIIKSQIKEAIKINTREVV